MKNIAVAPVILEDGRLSFCVTGDDGPPWSGVWNLTGKIVLDGDDYIYESIGHLVGWCFFRGGYYSTLDRKSGVVTHLILTVTPL